MMHEKKNSKGKKRKVKNGRKTKNKKHN